MSELNATKNTYTGIIFDLDGTLLNTLADIAYAVNHALETLGYPPRQVEEYRKFVGWGLKETFLRALPNQAEPDQNLNDKGLDLLMEEYRKEPAKRTYLYPGVEELLNYISKKNISMGILSNKADDLTQQIVDTLLSAWSFYAVSGTKPGVPRKPDPQGAEAVLQSMRLNPDQVLFLGDTAVDMELAKKVGMFAVGAEWGFRDKEELLSAGADVVISKPRELIAYL